MRLKQASMPATDCSVSALVITATSSPTVCDFGPSQVLGNRGTQPAFGGTSSSATSRRSLLVSTLWLSQSREPLRLAALVGNRAAADPQPALWAVDSFCEHFRTSGRSALPPGG